MISPDGLSASPKIQQIMITGNRNSVAAAIERNAFLGMSAERAAVPEYVAYAESVPGGLPAVLVTGKLTGKNEKMTTAASGSIIAVVTDHMMTDDAVFPPFLSFPSDATADGSVNTTTGTAMNTPRLTRKDDIPERISAAPGMSPKSNAVANPMRTAAIYVIHVFIRKGYSTGI